MLVFTEVHVSQEDLITEVQEGERQLNQSPPEEAIDERERSEAEREAEVAHLFSRGLAKQRMLEGVESAIRRRPGIVISPSVAELTFEIDTIKSQLDILTGVAPRRKARAAANKQKTVASDETFLITAIFSGSTAVPQFESKVNADSIVEVDGQQPFEFPSIQPKTDVGHVAAAENQPLAEQMTPEEVSARLKSLGKAIMSRERLVMSLQEQVDIDPKFVATPPIAEVRSQIDAFKAQIMQLNPNLDLEVLPPTAPSLIDVIRTSGTVREVKKTDAEKATLQEQSARIVRERQAADKEKTDARRAASLVEAEKRRSQIKDAQSVRQSMSMNTSAKQPAATAAELAKHRQATSGESESDDDDLLAWQNQALCAQTDPEAFFPEKGGSTRDAKRICVGCEVKQECLEYAVMQDERFGIWGGLSERERRRLKRKAS